jgi:hypothetical protein
MLYNIWISMFYGVVTREIDKVTLKNLFLIFVNESCKYIGADSFNPIPDSEV